ncbi:uncharacterized protein LAESUDRAFT_333434 [Laetiporus sulphureus 93-53]|uniref:Uncharacterized protein n=1 Tax=Laetiporus sulphureus 93-53 TaxID=1314785 RepID=A0A165CUY9_9APHY|nr:uncharacterized protein LAESUDRAFT_333434 [Laetiporus sulphureus 93-53]KZT03474.1 hypothetical protein LAESUDRAFT_333434 [Laetiporus sulphureus 93-53]
MFSGLSPFPSPPEIHSILFRKAPETVPPTDELQVLVGELQLVKQKALERAKKAGEDLKIIEESMRRLKEREKGKAKAAEKFTRERGFTPLPNGEETRLSVQPQPPISRPRVPPAPPISVPLTPTPAIESRRSMTEEMKKKKKKRKREDISDGEEPPKIRKVSPVPAHTHPHTPPVKTTKYPSASLVFNKPAGPDFALPPQSSLLPARPPVLPAPVAGPSTPTEVTEDFSRSKPPGNQVQVSTFYTSIEPWIRPIKEEDIGFLEYTGDDVEPFVLPKRGRHYSEVWEEEDTALYGGPLPTTVAVRATAPRHASVSEPLPRWEPSTLMETDLLTEERGHGPLSERLVSALIPMHDATEWKGVKAAEEAMEGRPGTNGAAAQAARDKLNVADLEDRVKNVLRFYGLLHETPDFSEAVDDPIATALRHAQRELRTVLATNKARRTRLAAIARDRLGYQEYLDLRDSIDKNITTLYSKLQKKDGPKSSKKKKKSAEPNGVANGTLDGLAALPPCPAALGLAQDEQKRLSVPEQLKKLVQTRRQWVDTVGGIFDEKETESPGRIYGLPKTSVYEGIEEEVRRELARLGLPAFEPGSKSRQGANGTLDARTSTTFSSKGKERAPEDYMEIG